jgi:hypothetical protein
MVATAQVQQETWREVGGYAKSCTGKLRALGRCKIVDGKLVPDGDWRQVHGASHYWVRGIDGAAWAEGTVRHPIGGFIKGRDDAAHGSEYLRLQIYDDNGVKRVRYLAELILTTFVCKRPKGAVVLYRDGDPKNCRLENLLWGTKKDKGAMSVARRTHAHGETHGKARLTAEQVAAIRTATGTQREVAKRFGVSRSTISMIQCGRNWKADAN